MAEMKITEVRTNAKENVSEALGLAQYAEIGAFTYAVPVTIDGQELFVEVKLTAKDHVGNKRTPAFNVDDAVAKYQAELAERAEKAAAKAAEKAEKEAKKAKRAVEPDAE